MIQSVFSTLIQVIVPLAIPVAAGALLVRLKGLETKHLLTLVLYCLLPCMVFDTLFKAQISFGDLYQTVLFCLFNLFLLWAIANIAGKLLKLAAPEVAGLTLISTLTNSVNYGLPLVLLAFGQAGLDKASVYVVIQMIIVNTFGVYFAARSSFSIKDALRSVFSLPAIYAAMLAVILRAFALHLPAGIEKGIDMIAVAYSPVVLAILGAQMAGVKNIRLERGLQAAFWSGMAIRSLIAPLAACLVLYALGAGGVLFSTCFILASMPVAVNAVILSEKFDASSHVVSKCILWTTLASFLVLPILIELVK
ncbi:MAG TPA: AEC family transporter [Bacillota bacterium]|nr:AEC family transporter [Bacillota bacterium]